MISARPQGGHNTYTIGDCQPALDEYCNVVDTACVDINRKDGYILPLVARFDRGKKSTTKAWRCYSPSSLSPDLSHYTNGSAYCSQSQQLESVLELCESGAVIVNLNATKVFSESEITECGQIRTPQLVATSSGKVLLFAQCRNAPAGKQKNLEPLPLTVAPSRFKASSSDGLKDDFRHTRMVLAESLDSGASWGPFRFVSEEGTGVGVAIWDRNTSALVFQYQAMPKSDPYAENTLWQKTSTDDGITFSAARNITSQISACNSDPKAGMVCGAAGSRIQMQSGRLIFSGHNKDHICVWFSGESRPRPPPACAT
jgi:hypothetical protein